MPSITEGQLTFEFPAGWVALKYDEANGFYKRTLDKHFTDLKAVDIVAADPSSGQLLLLEVKDFRGYGVVNRKRITSGELAEEVGQKVLHTLSGLYVGLRLRHPDLELLRGTVLSPPEKLDVVLLLEEDGLAGSSTIKQQNQKTNRQNLLTKLRSMFKPLTIKVHLYSQATVPARAGWSVP